MDSENCIGGFWIFCRGWRQILVLVEPRAEGNAGELRVWRECAKAAKGWSVSTITIPI